VGIMYWVVRRRWLTLAHTLVALDPGCVDVRHRGAATALWMFAASKAWDLCSFILSLGADPLLTGPDGTLAIDHLGPLRSRSLRELHASLLARGRACAERRRLVLTKARLTGHLRSEANGLVAQVLSQVMRLCDDLFLELCRLV
jgi:hypothetical protein